MISNETQYEKNIKFAVYQEIKARLNNLNVKKCLKRAGELYDNIRMKEHEKDVFRPSNGIRSRQIEATIQAIIEEIKGVL